MGLIPNLFWLLGKIQFKLIGGEALDFQVSRIYPCTA